ncbi:hypothetical protein ATK17_3031 [Branchiibius hedensis]|uniref:Uncharacterized protein n=1 Tax=Branchiibius hedensis TaxID=672460 RepID=A0A2Y8ZUG4_9MICO|nr:hypothetical protein [Branchiibius hedensis]PWJ26853.1 hypothetical protein ATK17_3031 [Branchiibius hedensis]SSA35664.1 hypothetical protein SAMN04489750_3031 [Branchiibius hedensis]
MTDLTASVAALFAGPVERFVPERDALAKRLRSAGQSEAADDVKALRRPTAAAVALNRLADDPVIAQVCELGERLREAQQRVDAVAMRDLSNERTATINRLLEALGQPAGGLREQVVATATAALADPAAAAALRSGRLTKALSYSGFGEVDLSDAVARWSAAAPAQEVVADPRPAEPDRRAAARLARLRRQVSTAEDELATATEQLTAAQQRHADAEAALATARDRLRTVEG